MSRRRFRIPAVAPDKLPGHGLGADPAGLTNDATVIDSDDPDGIVLACHQGSNDGRVLLSRQRNA